MCDAAVACMDIDAAAVSLRLAERVEDLVAASDGWAQRLEELQYTCGEGPGVEAGKAVEPVLVCDLHSDLARWPAFADGAVSAGLGAMFSFPLVGGVTRLGTLDLYRRRPGGLPADQLTGAALLADMAASALLNDVSPDWAARWAETPGHYDDVNMATGMLAEHLGVSVDEASARLRAHAFGSRQPLADVADAVLSRRLDGTTFRD